MINTDRLCLGCMNDNGGERVCPICGYDSSVPNGDDCLPAKFVIDDRYLIGRVVSSNGEGITYIGWDNSNDSIVSVREYFPVGAAKRNPDKTVLMVKGCEYTFNEGLMEFMEINRKLSSERLTAVFEVLSVFEENGTAYAVSRNVTCITLREFLTRNGGTLSWEQAKPLFMPLIDTVKTLNDSGIIHGGISPETIFVGRDGKLRLGGICISSVRRADSDITSQMFPGYAAIEQYGAGGMHINRCTDVYGLAATLFRVLIGTVPPESQARIENDSMSVPSHFADEIPHSVLTALANGLQVMPENRTQNVEIFREELIFGEISAETVQKQPVRSTKKTEEKAKPVAKEETAPTPKKKGGTAKYVAVSAVCTAVVFIIIAAVLMGTVFKKDIFGGNDESSQSSDEYIPPKVDVIGSSDSNAVESARLFSVPDLKGKYYSELQGEEYENFVFKIKGKEFSDTYPRGAICSQSVASGTDVERGTAIELVISLGKSEVKIANVTGLTEDKAKIELLKQGFLYDNIKVEDKYDADHEPGTVIEQEPKYGESVNTDVKVTIYVNPAEGGSAQGAE